jgi:hypothetical protein
MIDWALDAISVELMWALVVIIGIAAVGLASIFKK